MSIHVFGYEFSTLKALIQALEPLTEVVDHRNEDTIKITEIDIETPVILFRTRYSEAITEKILLRRNLPEEISLFIEKHTSDSGVARVNLVAETFPMFILSEMQKHEKASRVVSSPNVLVLRPHTLQEKIPFIETHCKIKGLVLKEKFPENFLDKSHVRKAIKLQEWQRQ